MFVVFAMRIRLEIARTNFLEYFFLIAAALDSSSRCQL